MVGTDTHSAENHKLDNDRVDNDRAGHDRSRWQLRASLHRSPSIVSMLERLDDDPILFCDFLFCDCAEGSTQPCG
jgi:hypothetical protein